MARMLVTPMSKFPTTPATEIARTPARIPGGQEPHDDKMLVTVRVRPPSKRELALNKPVAWDCRDQYTILSKNVIDDCSIASFTFNRVFNATCSTQKVYEQEAKAVILSIFTGTNATIYAYGQSSSGKTFTMRGIADYAVKDIYNHIRNNPEREFILKFSALEIYNETIMNLLNRESGPLGLFDDPKKGIIVPKLIEGV
ncbi:hypothetical protein Sjap_011987 [Stephania japonica]|uniref:Kinesin motor domain-containing protein n=1 Tax=Stephania japonica TaxID=461633 RepID=A0AAP0P7W5_9MAGN